jgi:transcriptional regulator with XRE-family HTH domain
VHIKGLRCPFPDNWITTQKPPQAPKTLGEHLKRRRLELHLLQTDVARRLGVHFETLKNWERGIGSPMVRHIPAIIKFLGYDPEPEPEALPKRIAYARRRLGMTQEQLAEALSVDPVTVYRWEKGMSCPPESTILKLERMVAKSRHAFPQ